jgi:hypothetical protein
MSAVTALKHAAVGSVIGAAAVKVADLVVVQVNSMVPTAPGYARGVLMGVIGGSVATLTILAGEKAITQLIAEDDPLFRIFFYQAAFRAGTSSLGFVSAFQVALNHFMPTANNSPYGPPMLPLKKKCDDCTATGKNCSGCSGH